MTLAAPTPVSLVAALIRLIGLPLPASPAARGRVIADQVTLSHDEPTATALWTMATAGLRQVTTLLPALERAIGPNTSANASADALGHLARSVGGAAHQVGTGFGSLLEASDLVGRPSAAALEGWRTHAASTLDTTSSLLQRAEQSATMAFPAGPETWWAMSELVSAQRQVRTAIDQLQAGLTPLTPPVRPSALARLIDRLLAAILLLIALLAVAVWFGAEGILVLVLCLGAFGGWLRRLIAPRPQLRLQINSPCADLTPCDGPPAAPTPASRSPPSAP